MNLHFVAKEPVVGIKSESIELVRFHQAFLAWSYQGGFWSKAIA